MDRRDFLKNAGLGIAIGALSPKQALNLAWGGKRIIESGWIPNKASRQWAQQKTRPYFETAARHLKGSGENQRAFLWKFFEIVAEKECIPHEQTGPDCFIAGTMVLGEQIKPIEQIKIGDKIWTGEGKLSEVISTRQIQRSQPCIKIHARGMMPITCTPDHRFLVYRLGEYGKRKISGKLYAHYTARGYKKESFLDVYEKRLPTWIKAEDLTENDCLLTPKQIEIRLQSPLNHEGDFLWGYFLGDGYASKYQIELALNRKHVKLKNKLITIIKNLGYKCSIYECKNRNATRICICSIELCKLLRDQFYIGKIKHFPGWAIGNQEFLNGLKAADGHSRKKYHIITSTSQSIIQGVNLSLIALGHIGLVHGHTDFKLAYPNQKASQRIHWTEKPSQQSVWSDEQFVYRYIKKIEYIEGQTTVYDIGVKDSHHSFLANGSATHNCVSHATGLGIDILTSVQIAHHKYAERWVAETATEPIHAGSRVEIGKNRARLGSYGSWAMRWINEYGVLLRLPYLDNKYDFTTYSGKKAVQWGHTCNSCTGWGGGVPEDLEIIAKQHQIKTFTLVKTWKEACDAIANGYPVIVCSGLGFSQTRDELGFAAQNDWWNHAMLIAGIDTVSPRPGGLILNSWGTWNSGPKMYGQPEGSFWADADTINRMLAEEDSYAISQYVGYPRQELNYKLY